ncbi:conserved hypothetical protein [Shewanella sediminis HAW-EB3]|uniref:Uncharacterized protein n=2 Tax=Shewanella sediminis TaxID=271097 RepID=A8FWX6_SHESH|nr:hypothetical protein [Shewanella sediminis]ABV37349.1 conserved hypothetical protein [Shewanella sediminis HAW-EB3]
MQTSASYLQTANKSGVRNGLLLLSLSLMVQLPAVAAPMASEAEIAFNHEVLECASYYQISSDAISQMNAPQMKVVGERLLHSSQDAIALAEKYQSKDQVADTLSSIREKQLASLPNSKSLGGLMGKYKDRCKSLLAEPQKRLDYWTMATM